MIDTIKAANQWQPFLYVSFIRFIYLKITGFFAVDLQRVTVGSHVLQGNIGVTAVGSRGVTGIALGVNNRVDVVVFHTLTPLR